VMFASITQARLSTLVARGAETTSTTRAAEDAQSVVGDADHKDMYLLWNEKVNEDCIVFRNCKYIYIKRILYYKILIHIIIK